jgi:hypothetical protein
MKKTSLLVPIISMLLALSGCSSNPMYGAKSISGNFYCFTVADYEYQNYEAKLFNGSGELLSTVLDVEIEESTSRYSTGTCNLAVTLSDVPLGSGPYLVDFLVNGSDVLDTYEFESFDFEY